MTSLELMRSNVDDFHAAMLAPLLRDNTSITEILLDNNSVGDEGATVFGDVIRYGSGTTL